MRSRKKIKYFVWDRRGNSLLNLKICGYQEIEVFSIVISTAQEIPQGNCLWCEAKFYRKQAKFF